MRSLIITRKAQFDIWRNMEWLETEYRPAVASKWHAAILRAAGGLQKNPDPHPSPEDIALRVVDLREKLVRYSRGIVYRIIYSFDDNTVTIHRVRNASQDSLTEDDF